MTKLEMTREMVWFITESVDPFMGLFIAEFLAENNYAWLIKSEYDKFVENKTRSTAISSVNNIFDTYNGATYKRCYCRRHWFKLVSQTK